MTDSRDLVESRGGEDSRGAVEARGVEARLDAGDSRGEVDSLEAAEVRAWEDWLDTLESSDASDRFDAGGARDPKRPHTGKRSRGERKQRADKRTTDGKRSRDAQKARGAKKSRPADGNSPAASTPRAERIGRYGTPITELGLLAEETLALAIATRATEAQLLRAQASILAWLAEGNRVEPCGFASLSSLALEVLGIRPRTVRERLALHRIFLRHPAMERAFLDGKVTACQVLAVAPLPGGMGGGRGGSGGFDRRRRGCFGSSPRPRGADTSANPDSDSTGHRRPPVSPSAKSASRRARSRRSKSERDQARRREESPDEPEGRTISFTAPAGFRSSSSR